MKIIIDLFRKYLKLILEVFRNILNYLHNYKIKSIKVNNLRYFGISVSVVVVVVVFFINSSKNDNVGRENELLKAKLKTMVTQYKKMSEKIDSLSYYNNQLRIAVNLEPISEAENKLGIGGSKDITLSYSLSENSINNAIKYVDELTRKLEFEKNQYSIIAGKIKDNKKEYENIPAIKPIDAKYMTSGFGMRFHPILHQNIMHDGIDLLAEIGTPVMASGNGVVVFTGNKNGYGNVIEIDHGYGYHTVYGHLSEILVSVGQQVKRREVIGKSGNSGLSTGPHLHYEVSLNGEKINPLNFFFDDLNLY